jgi:hypothetical protein
MNEPSKTSGSSGRPHHRPLLPGAGMFSEIEGGVDPALLSEAADRAATVLVRGSDGADEQLLDRVVHLAESEGIETLAQLWSGSPPDSLAGTLWRLYLLRAWVYADPQRAVREFNDGRLHAPVAEAITGVIIPPGPDEIRKLVDAVLAGVVQGDFVDTIFRAAAFARVTAAGRAHAHTPEGSTSYDNDLSAARLLTLAQQLEHSGHLELAGHLA